MGLSSEVTFNTTGEDGNPHTITVGNDGNGYIANTGTANITGANLTLDAGSAEWVKDISVNADGNIVLNVKSSGVYILVR